MTTQSPKQLKQNIETVTPPDTYQLPDKYKFLKVMGEGSFGKVLQCLDKDTDNLVAIKLPLSPDVCFKEEVATLKRLMSLKLDEHSIVKFHESFSVKEGEALVFESLEMSVFNYINQNSCRPMTLTQTRTITKELATALKALKNIGMIHADIKPDNVMLVDRKLPLRAKLIDFGVAMDRSAAEQGMLIQAVSFRAPEIILGLPFSEGIDMWSLGCMIFTMLFGIYLFEAEELDTLQIMMDLLGQPSDEFLNQAGCTYEFFNRTKSNSWRLKTREEYWKGKPPKAPRKRNLSSLDDLKKMSIYYQDEAAAYEQCIELMKAMLTIDQKERITPDEVLQHPFITNLHNEDNEINKEANEDNKDEDNEEADKDNEEAVEDNEDNEDNEEADDDKDSEEDNEDEDNEEAIVDNEEAVEDNEDNEEADDDKVSDEDYEDNEEAVEDEDNVGADKDDEDSMEANEEDRETPLIPDDGDSKKKTTKNCFQRFRSWFNRRYFCNRVGVM